MMISMYLTFLADLLHDFLDQYVFPGDNGLSKHVITNFEKSEASKEDGCYGEPHFVYLHLS